MKKNSNEDLLQIPSVPQFETRIQTIYDDGMVRGTNNSVWMLRTVPLASVTDARTVRDAVNVGTALYQAYADLSALAGRGKHRRQVKKSYRRTHALLLNIPEHYRPPRSTKIRDYLARENQHLVPMRRELIFATLMTPTTGNGTFASAWDSVVETWQNGGSPLSDYARDRDQLTQLFARCGFEIPDEETIHFADSWWNNGKSAGIPVLPHEQHMHYFRTMGAAKAAQHYGVEDCDRWPESEYEHAISFADVENFDLRYMSSAEQASRWVTSLIDAGARVVSIRASIEPGKVTREELRAQKRRYKSDLEELQTQGKMDRHEVNARFSELDSVEAAYSKGGPPTLHNASVVIGFSGVVDDADQLAPSGIVLSNMLNRQAAAWHETMLCSPVRANPHVQDLPATAVAYSGMPSLSVVGDEYGDSLAFLGLTENDRQPAHVSATAASDGETLPIFGVYGATGSGKTAVLQWLAHQWAKCGRPQLILNPKQGNPMSAIADASGWSRSSLDEFASSDGALDPLRMFPSRVDAVTKALSMLVTVNPIGEDIRRYTTDLSFALDYGSKHGATVTGEALMVAREANQISSEIVDPIFRFAEVFPMFRATFGMDPSSQQLSLADGTTLIDVGDTSFDLPPEGFTGDPGDLRNPVTRTSMNIIRMLLWGGMAAFRHKGGVIHLDESWVVEKSAPDELDQIGRLARAWDILPVLYTQKPSVQSRLGLKGYISRALIGSIKDEDEARAALELFNLDKNTRYLERLVAPEYLPGGKALNPQSLRPLVDSDGQVFRGSVFYYADLRNRVAPVEVSLSEEFLSLARAKDLVGRKADAPAVGAV